MIAVSSPHTRTQRKPSPADTAHPGADCTRAHTTPQVAVLQLNHFESSA